MVRARKPSLVPATQPIRLHPGLHGGQADRPAAWMAKGTPTQKPALSSGGSSKQGLRLCTESAAFSCHCPIQIVSDALQYFGLHFREPIPITDLPGLLGISEDCLTLSFERIRGMTPAQALQEHRLNHLFAALRDQPRQGLAVAIRSCGLGQTHGVVALFEQTFGIEMPLFLLMCRRAADDRNDRRLHPHAEALVLPTR